MSEHYDLATLLWFINGVEKDVALAAHVETCVACRETLSELRLLKEILRDPDVFGHADEYDDGGWRDVLRAELIEEEREALALNVPVEADLDAILTSNTADPVDRRFLETLLLHVEVELDRRPAAVLRSLDFVEQHVKGDDAQAKFLLGDVWKQRSNAYRALTRYDDALSAAALAEAFYSSIPNAEFDIGQARYTYAATLVKRTQYREAAAVLDRAEAILRPFGVSVPLMKLLMLRATISFQTGAVAEAERLWREILPVLERHGEMVDSARLVAGLAECARMRGAYDESKAYATDAIARYRALGMDTESVRTEWTFANLHLNCGDTEAGMESLRLVAQRFKALEMHGDAGHVHLDLVEALLAAEEWDEAERIARELCELFASAGVTLASIQALDYLRTAVEHQSATTALVQYVREFVELDDPARPFLPPSREAGAPS